VSQTSCRDPRSVLTRSARVGSSDNGESRSPSTCKGEGPHSLFRFPFIFLPDLKGLNELDQVFLRRKVSGDVSLEEGTHL
jgi:hypothetical protein